MASYDALINMALLPQQDDPYAVAFHGFDDTDIPYDILVGGCAPDTLKEEIKCAIEDKVGLDFTVHITEPGDNFGGDDERNIVNRLTAGGASGVQIEQKNGPREKYWGSIADAVTNVFNSKL